MPGSNWRNELLKKSMPLFTNTFGGWLNFPDYFFFWAYHGQNAVFNTMAYQNAVMDKMITNARFAESKPLYDGMVKDMITLAHEQVPRILVMEGAFHGRTMGALSATHSAKYQEGFTPLLEGFDRPRIHC